MLITQVVAAVALCVSTLQAAAVHLKRVEECFADRWYRNVECETCPEWIGYGAIRYDIVHNGHSDSAEIKHGVKDECSTTPERYSNTSGELDKAFATSQSFPNDLQKGPDVWLWWTCSFKFCVLAPNPFMLPWPKNASDYIQNHEVYDNGGIKPAPKAPYGGYVTPLPKGQKCPADKWYLGDDGQRWVKYNSKDREGCREWETDLQKISQLEKNFQVAQEADGMKSSRTNPAWVCDMSACSLTERYDT